MAESLGEKTLKGVMWKFAERISAQLVSTIVSIVLARLLLPEDYGLVAIVTILITICNIFVTSGFGNSLIQKKDADDVDFSSVLYVSIVLSIAFYALIFFIAPLMAEFYDNDLLTPVLRVMGLRIPIAAINSVQHAYVARKMIFKKFFWATLIGTIVSGGVGIYMAYSGYGVWALVAQYLINVLIDTLILGIVLKWLPKLVFSFSRLKDLLSYGWKLLVSGLMRAGCDEIRGLIIGKKYVPSDLAYFEQGKKYPQIVSTNITVSLNNVLLSAMSKVQDDRKKLKEITRKSVRLCSYVVFPLMIGLAAVADAFIEVLLTDKWLFTVPYLQIMCIAYIFQPIQMANVTAIQAMGRSDLYLKMDIIKNLISISAIIVSMWFGVIWIAVSQIFVYFTWSIINAFPNKKLLEYGYIEQISDVFCSIVISIIMGVAVYFIGWINIDKIVLLVLQVVSGIVIYVCLSLVTRHESFYYLINKMKSFSRKKKKLENN